MGGRGYFGTPLSVQQDASPSAAVGSIRGRKYEWITAAGHGCFRGRQASSPTLQQP